MTTGKPTPQELAAAATELQRAMDREVVDTEYVLRSAPLNSDDRRAKRARLVVYDRLSKSLARIIASGAPARSGDDVSSGE